MQVSVGWAALFPACIQSVASAPSSPDMSSGATPAAVKIGIIGGTGLDDPEILEGRTEKYVDTPFGKVSIYGDILAFFFFLASLIFLSYKKKF